MLFAMAGMAIGGWLVARSSTRRLATGWLPGGAFNLLNLMLLGALYIAQRRRVVSLP